MLNMEIGYPDFEDEVQIVMQTTSTGKPSPHKIMDGPAILHYQELVRKVPVSPFVVSYAVSLAQRSRPQTRRFTVRQGLRRMGRRPARFAVSDPRRQSAHDPAGPLCRVDRRYSGSGSFRAPSPHRAQFQGPRRRALLRRYHQASFDRYKTFRGRQSREINFHFPNTDFKFAMPYGICHLGFFPLSRKSAAGADNFGIDVRGNRQFRWQTRQALALLYPLEQFELIRRNISIIRQARRSGMKAWAKKPTFLVGKPTWRHSVVWYAGAIAHDAYHGELYAGGKTNCTGKAPEADVWSGVEAETKCLVFQAEVLLALNAEPTLIGYVNQWRQNPTYQGCNKGWRSWLDYLKRQW